MPFTFLHPGLFALGVACVSIPIILHLLKRKRRPIPWAAMQFLEQAYRKRRRRMTIEQLIMLALRCSLIVLIAAGVGAIMLGQPNSQSRPNTLTIIIDNSIGSALMVDGQMSIDAYKQAAIAQLNTLDPAKGDRAALIIGAKPARALVLPASSDIAQLIRLINEIQPTDSMFDLQGSVSLAAQTNAQEHEIPQHHSLLIASNARGGLHEPNANTIAHGFDQIISPRLPSQIINNIGILSSSPMRSLVTRTGLLLPMSIRVELLRTGNLAEENQSTTITITDPENNTLGARTVQWADGQSQLDAIVPINPQQLRSNNTQAALLKVQIDNDANQRDNHRLVAIPSVETIRVGVLDRASDMPGIGAIDKQTAADLSPARWIKAALSPTDGMGIEIKVFDASRASSLLSPGLNAAIVLAPAAMNESGWRRLKELNESGMMVIIAQDAQSESTSWVQHANTLLPPAAEFLGLVENLDTPAELNSSMNIDDHSIIAELRNEYPDLARPVTVNQFMHMQKASGPDSSQVRTILQLSTGEPIIEQVIKQIKHAENQGTLVTLAIAIDLQWTNLPARGLFVPLMQELIREGVGKSVNIPSKIAGNQSKNPPWVVSTHRLDSFPTFKTTDPTISNAGVLALVDQQSATRSISLIHPDTRSAKTKPTDQQSFTTLIAKMTGNASNDHFEITWLDTNPASPDESTLAKAAPNPANTNNQLALWMLFGACIIALIETTLAKLFSVKSEQPSAQEARG